jgi:7-keto-8-aminopelargonate synthetase-like enzyme
VNRYGTQFSSSRTYVQAPPYEELEECLTEMFGAHALVVPSTSLGHVAALPVLVGTRDLVLVDRQVHQSVQMSVDHLRVQGTAVQVIGHNDLDAVGRALEAWPKRDARVWYLADGVYSMFADIAPLGRMANLLRRDSRLHLYIDDSHGIGWMGQHGRGPALDLLGAHERVVVAASLNKSFAAAGAALLFPTRELKRRVRSVSGPLTFSGPVQPPMLGAALSSARIHLSDELVHLQQALRERIDLCTRLLCDYGVPRASTDRTPILFIPVGQPLVAGELARRLLEDGFYTHAASFPAVPFEESGIRFMLTLHHQPADIHSLVEAIASHRAAILGVRADRPAGHSDPTHRCRTVCRVSPGQRVPRGGELT